MSIMHIVDNRTVCVLCHFQLGDIHSPVALDSDG